MSNRGDENGLLGNGDERYVPPPPIQRDTQSIAPYLVPVSCQRVGGLFVNAALQMNIAVHPPQQDRPTTPINTANHNPFRLVTPPRQGDVAAQRQDMQPDWRTMCSKCGRFADAHFFPNDTELCGFTDCAKCGRSIEEHESLNVPMGWFCPFTEPNHKVDAYYNTIRDRVLR